MMSAEPSAHILELRFDGRPGDHFTWDELQRTSTGLNNAAPSRALTCLQILVQFFLDPLRKHLDRPIRVTSGYRAAQVNRAIGGSKTSRHMTGEAADFKVNLSHDELLSEITSLGLSFDQLIFYAPKRGGHVHVQICAGAPSKHRHQVLWAPASGGYEPYRSNA
jgi:zinc D-Ala-D-Ala carboxypeptidase